MFVIVGVTLIVFGLVVLWSFRYMTIFGLVSTLIGIVIVFTKKGTLIDFKERKIKKYVGLFFVKIGKWKTFEEYSTLCLLHLNQKGYGYSITGVAFSELKKNYRVCLLNETHRRRLELIDFTNQAEAILEAKKIAKGLNMELVKFSPK